MQFASALVIAGVAVGGYYVLQSSVSWTNTKVDTLGIKVDTAIKTNADSLKDQDAKRDQLGKDLLAKQDTLNTKVSELNTSVQLLQHDTSATADTLKTISTQLTNLTVHTVPSSAEGKQSH